MANTESISDDCIIHSGLLNAGEVVGAITKAPFLLDFQRAKLIEQMEFLLSLDEEARETLKGNLIRQLEDVANAFNDLFLGLELEHKDNNRALIEQDELSLEQRLQTYLDGISTIAGKVEKLKDGLKGEKVSGVSIGVRAVLGGLFDRSYRQLTPVEQRRVVCEIERLWPDDRKDIILDDELGSVTN